MFSKKVILATGIGCFLFSSILFASQEWNDLSNNLEKLYNKIKQSNNKKLKIKHKTELLKLEESELLEINNDITDKEINVKKSVVSLLSKINKNIFDEKNSDKQMTELKKGNRLLNHFIDKKTLKLIISDGIYYCYTANDNGKINDKNFETQKIKCENIYKDIAKQVAIELTKKEFDKISENVKSELKNEYY